MVKIYFDNIKYSNLVYDRQFKPCIEMLEHSIQEMQETVKTLKGFERGSK